MNLRGASALTTILSIACIADFALGFFLLVLGTIFLVSYDLWWVILGEYRVIDCLAAAAIHLLISLALAFLALLAGERERSVRRRLYTRPSH